MVGGGGEPDDFGIPKMAPGREVGSALRPVIEALTKWSDRYGKACEKECRRALSGPGG